MSDLYAVLQTRLQQAICKSFGDTFQDTDPLLRPTQDPKFGDFQANVAMSLAKALQRKPRDIAETICANAELTDLCETPEIAGPGFINLRILPTAIADQLLVLAGNDRLAIENDPHLQTVVVDYSGPNVAKEMHVGHLRSTIIGDAIAKVLEFLGHKVIRQNHLGDWGTQFGMLIEHLIDSGWKLDEGKSIGDLNVLYQESKKRFDADEDFAERARQRVVALQGGDTETRALWQELVKASRNYFSEVYDRLHVSLQDDDARGESSYNETLQDTIEELSNKGLTQKDQGATVVYLPEFVGRDEKPLPLIVQKSDGGYLYATTDLACLRYRIRQLHADRVIYVTDARQSQHFAMVFKTAELAGWVDSKAKLEHVPFGSVLGEDGKPFKTRSGEVVRLIQLIEEAERRALEVVSSKNPDLSVEQQHEVADTVGVGAIKYSDLSNDRVKDYVFSWDRMLAMEGNTAPYLQYAYTRVQSIFRKGMAQLADMDITQLHTTHIEIKEPIERQLALKLFQLQSILHSVAERSEPHRLCNYLFELATLFSSFYEACPVLKAETEISRNSRLLLCELTARTLKLGLNLLGIRVLEKM
ncbi:MAG: arginyl-tRNA synthetase [Gammaproteobacteria bacterium SG8_11]|nr:MAG: arginyl-tRNA synthetase [Gammaproteobacteria bacterium SG8_11]